MRVVFTMALSSWGAFELQTALLDLNGGGRIIGSAARC